MKQRLTFKRKLIIFFSILLILALFFWANFSYPRLIAIESCKIVSLEGDTMTLSVRAQVYNPNSFGASLTAIKSKVFIENEVIGTSKLIIPTVISGKDSTLISFESKVSLKTLSDLFPQLMNKSKASIQIDGIFSIQALWGIWNIPAKTSDELPFREEIAKIIQETLDEDAFKIKRIWPVSISAFKTDFMLQVSFANKQVVAHTLVAVDLDLYLNDNKEAFGNWTLEKAIPLQPKEQKTIEGKVNVKNLKVVRQIITSMFSKKEVTARGYGIVQFSNYQFKVPIKQSLEMSSVLF